MVEERHPVCPVLADVWKVCGRVADTGPDTGPPSGASAGTEPSPPDPAPSGVAQLSRRRVLRVAGGVAALGVGAGALYAVLGRMAAPARTVVGPPPGGYPAGQYQIAQYGVQVRPDPASAVEVILPPVWNMAITATLARAPGMREQRQLEAALGAVEAAYPYAPGGVFALVAYGLPYFRGYVHPAVLAAHLPRMAADGTTPVLLDAVRFASDPPGTLLEANDVVFHLRSDSLEHLQDVQRAWFGRGGTLAGQPAAAADLSSLFHVTSVRTGFVGAGLPRQLAQHAGLAIADQIPDAAPLFMGFTSTQQTGQANEVAVSFDGKRDPRLQPLTTARPGDYFAGGTSLHVSHLFEDLASWYALSYPERVARMFHLGATAPAGRVTIQTQWLNPNTSATDAQEDQVIGHNEAVQRGSRAPEGQALQLRVDFNTMDALDGPSAAPGLHFLAFTPGSSVFHQSRMGMDATDLAAQYGIAPQANGINSFLRVTRRQNFLVPPRAHRAFPLVELGS